MKSKRCFVGFDGFIDTICHVVASRQGENYEAYTSIASWAESVKEASGKSGNFELKRIEERAGGNAMILAKGLSTLGHQVDWIANVDHPQVEGQIHPLFAPLGAAAKNWRSLGAAGQTQALEFLDGKLLFGIQGITSKITLLDLEQRLGKDWIEQWLWPSDLIALVNWTMTLEMGQFWRQIAKIGLGPKKEEKPWLLIDLADPKKRDLRELKEDLLCLDPLKDSAKLLLGLNLSEATQVALALGLEIETSSKLTDLASSIRQKLPWFAIVIHDLRFSALASSEGAFQIDNPWISNPRVATGAGDHFNAGFCHALLQNASLEKALQVGAKVASLFVQSGNSPQADSLADYF